MPISEQTLERVRTASRFELFFVFFAVFGLCASSYLAQSAVGDGTFTHAVSFAHREFPVDIYQKDTWFSDLFGTNGSQICFPTALAHRMILDWTQSDGPEKGLPIPFRDGAIVMHESPLTSDVLLSALREGKKILLRIGWYLSDPSAGWKRSGGHYVNLYDGGMTEAGELELLVVNPNIDYSNRPEAEHFDIVEASPFRFVETNHFPDEAYFQLRGTGFNGAKTGFLESASIF